MPSGPAGGPRPFAQSEYAIVVEVSGGMGREMATAVANQLRSVYGDDNNIIPAKGGSALALVINERTTKENLDRAENKVKSISGIGPVRLSIRPV